MIRSFALALVAALAACSSPGYMPHDLDNALQVSINPMSLPQENIMEDGHAPTPYSAKQIHEAMPEYGGRYYLLRGDSESSMVNYNFDHVTETDCSIETMYFDMDGFTSTTETEDHVLWTDLQYHASFPLDEVTITEVRLELAAGTFDCWNYTLNDAFPGRDEFYFAKDLPGPPVYMRSLDDDGTVIFEMELRDFAPAK